MELSQFVPHKQSQPDRCVLKSLYFEMNMVLEFDNTNMNKLWTENKNYTPHLLVIFCF